MKIVISGILPRAENRHECQVRGVRFLERINRTAIQVNRTIRDIAEKTDWLTYVCHADFVERGEINRRFLSFDGLHLSWKGTPLVVQNIETAVSKLRAPVPRAKQSCVTRRKFYAVSGPRLFSDCLKGSDSFSVGAEPVSVSVVAESDSVRIESVASSAESVTM